MWKAAGAARRRTSWNRGSGKLRILANLFANYNLPQIDDYRLRLRHLKERAARERRPPRARCRC